MMAKKVRTLGIILPVSVLLYCLHMLITNVIFSLFGDKVFVVVGALTNIAVFIVPVIIYLRKADVSIKELCRFDSEGFGKKTAIYFIIATAMTVVSVTAVGQATDMLLSLFGKQTAVENNGVFEFVFIFIRNVLIAPVIEEFLFRGVVLNATAGMKNRYRILLSALLFALGHYNLQAGIYAFVGGIVLAYFALKSGSLLFAVLVHFAQNAVSFIFAVLRQVLDNNVYTVLTVSVFAVLVLVSVLGILYLIKDKKRISNAPENVEKCSVAFRECVPFVVLSTVLSIFNLI